MCPEPLRSTCQFYSDLPCATEADSSLVPTPLQISNFNSSTLPLTSGDNVEGRSFSSQVWSSTEISGMLEESRLRRNALHLQAEAEIELLTQSERTNPSFLPIRPNFTSSSRGWENMSSRVPSEFLSLTPEPRSSGYTRFQGLEDETAQGSSTVLLPSSRSSTTELPPSSTDSSPSPIFLPPLPRVNAKYTRLSGYLKHYIFLNTINQERHLHESDLTEEINVSKAVKSLIHGLASGLAREQKDWEREYAAGVEDNSEESSDRSVREGIGSSDHRETVREEDGTRRGSTETQRESLDLLVSSEDRERTKRHGERRQKARKELKKNKRIENKGDGKEENQNLFAKIPNPNIWSQELRNLWKKVKKEDKGKGVAERAEENGESSGMAGGVLRRKREERVYHGGN